MILRKRFRENVTGRTHPGRHGNVSTPVWNISAPAAERVCWNSISWTCPAMPEVFPGPQNGWKSVKTIMRREIWMPCCTVITDNIWQSV